MVSDHSFQVSFVDGTACTDNGWDVDEAAEYARAFFILPSWVRRVVWIRLYALSVAAETHSMELDITANAGSDNQAYNAEAINVTSKACESINFAANDIIYWEIDSGDDADIGHLVGGDCVELKVVYAAADGDNCATDARFRCVHVGVV